MFKEPQRLPFQIVYYPHLNMHMAKFYFFPGQYFVKKVQKHKTRGYNFNEVIDNTKFMIAGFHLYTRIMPWDFPHIKRDNILSLQLHTIKSNIDKILHHESVSNTSTVE